MSATNVPLTQLVEQGQFRRDLLYRLDVLRISVPPLRARAGDVEYLAEGWMQRLRKRYERPEVRLAPAGLTRLASHPWPGNVRELQNVLHRAFLMSSDPMIGPEDLLLDEPSESVSAGSPLPLHFELSFREAKERVVEEFEHRYLRQLMIEAKGNVTWAARRVGKERRALGKMLKRHGIDRREFE